MSLSSDLGAAARRRRSHRQRAYRALVVWDSAMLIAYPVLAWAGWHRGNYLLLVWACIGLAWTVYNLPRDRRRAGW